MSRIKSPQARSRNSHDTLLPSILSLLIVVGTLTGLLFVPQSVRAQNTADLNQYIRLEQQFTQQKYSGKWDAAGETARQMVQFSQQRRMPTYLQVAAVDCVAIVEINLGNYAEALKLYQQIVAESKKVQPDNATIADARNICWFNGLNGIARSYRLQNKYDDAIEAFQAAIEFAKRVGKTDLAAAAGTDLAHLLFDRGLYQEAITEFQKSLPPQREIARRRNSSANARISYAHALQGLASAYMSLGRYNDAEPLARDAFAWADSAVDKNHTFRASALKTLALIYSYQNRYEEAVQLYEEAARIYTETAGADHPMGLSIKNNLARIYVIVGRGDEGIQLGNEVLAAYRKRLGAEDLHTVNSLANLGNIYFQLDRYDEAAPLLAESLAMCIRLLPPESPQRTGTLRLQCANELLRGGDRGPILESLNSIVKIYQETPTSPGDLAAAFSMRATVHNELGQRQEALDDINEAMKQSELQRALSSGGDRERAKLFEDYTLVYARAMLWHAEEGGDGIATAFGIAERMKARSFMDALHTANFDFLKELPADERERYQAEEKRLRDAVTKAQQTYDVVSGETEEGDPRRVQAAVAIYVARDRLYDHLMDVQNANPTYRNLITDRNEAATLDEVQAELMQDDELLLSYAAAGPRMFVFSIRKDSATFTELLVDEATAKALGIEAGEFGAADQAKIFLGDEGLLKSISRPTDSLTLEPNLAALWNLLVPEQDRAALQDGSIKLLTVLPDGLMALLPLEALIVERTGDAPMFLLDVGPPVVYAPSASVLLNLVKRPARETSGSREPVFTLGDPAYDQASSDEARIAGFRAGLSRLPYSGQEAEWVAQHFSEQGVSSVKLLGNQATEAQVRRLASGREIVHMACHGMADDRYGNFFGCLAVAPGRQGDANDDGFLYTPEIYDLDLNGCELAILSACETNLGPQQTGEGVWTISRGFLVSGARRVVASNWVINDFAGATLVSDFAHNLAAVGTDTSRRAYADSLHRAKMSLRKQASWSHPFYWSSLVLVGPK